MNKSETIRKLIIDILSDEDEHTTGEIKRRISSENSSLLSKNSTLSVALSDMHKKNLVFRVRKGVYMLKMENESKKKDETYVNRGEKKLLQQWREFSDMRIAEASYEMSVEEFIENKKIYELSRDVEKMIISRSEQL